MRANESRNQHFVTHVEQKLNACNPKSRSGRFRIYSFRIAERESYRLALEQPHGRPIHSNLAMLDLFSFDIAGGKRLRSNLEQLFQKYEQGIERHTRALLEKLSQRELDVREELVELFAAKLLNFVRNPFCIEKVLNSFPGVANVQPTNPGLLATYRQIIAGKRPHQSHLCAQLGISDQRYAEWLRMLFMLLAPISPDGANLFEGVIKGLLENRGSHIGAFLAVYDQPCVLLSDRGFAQPVADDPRIMAMSFNLCSTAFIDFAFADAATLLQGRANHEFVARALANWKKRAVSTVNLTVMHNDRTLLARYNRRVVEQSHSRVYCAVKDGLVFRGVDQLELPGGHL
jgi:hypothetical protein